MPSVVRAITRIQDADDFTGSLTDTYIPVWSSSQQKFVMTAQSVTAPGGSSGYIQYNNAGAFGASGVYWDSANSRVGIGTISPGQKLDVNGSVNVATALVVPAIKPASDSTTALQLQNAAGTAVVTIDTVNNTLNMPLNSTIKMNNIPLIGYNSSLNTFFGLTSAISGPLDTYFSTGRAMYFRVNGNSLSWTSALMLRQDGNVGIGTTSPNNKLDVAGTVQMDGLRIDVTPTAKTITCTHVVAFSANGTNYEIPCAAA